MMNFLLEAIKRLSKINVEGDPITNGRRMLSATIIICSLYKMIPSYIKIEEISSFLISTSISMLCLLPDVQKKKCDDWDYLLNYIPREFNETVYEAIQFFIHHINCKNLLKQPSWLYAIPVLHFLKQMSYPFQEVEYDFKKIPWKDEFTAIREKTQYNTTSQ